VQSVSAGINDEAIPSIRSGGFSSNYLHTLYASCRRQSNTTSRIEGWPFQGDAVDKIVIYPDEEGECNRADKRLRGHVIRK
jgi:hypothetical protein